MWILTQNGERILSTEAMDEIRVSDPMVGKTDYAVMLKRRIDGKPFALGFYHRKERAVSILREILREQGKYISCEGGTDMVTGRHQQAFVTIPPKTYMMPPDQEERD